MLLLLLWMEHPNGTYKIFKDKHFTNLFTDRVSLPKDSQVIYFTDLVPETLIIIYGIETEPGYQDPYKQIFSIGKTIFFMVRPELYPLFLSRRNTDSSFFIDGHRPRLE